MSVEEGVTLSAVFFVPDVLKVYSSFIILSICFYSIASLYHYIFSIVGFSELYTAGVFFSRIYSFM